MTRSSPTQLATSEIRHEPNECNHSMGEWARSGTSRTHGTNYSPLALHLLVYRDASRGKFS